MIGRIAPEQASPQPSQTTSDNVSYVRLRMVFRWENGVFFRIALGEPRSSSPQSQEIMVRCRKKQPRRKPSRSTANSTPMPYTKSSAISAPNRTLSAVAILATLIAAGGAARYFSLTLQSELLASLAASLASMLLFAPACYAIVCLSWLAQPSLRQAALLLAAIVVCFGVWNSIMLRGLATFHILAALSANALHWTLFLLCGWSSLQLAQCTVGIYIAPSADHLAPTSSSRGRFSIAKLLTVTAACALLAERCGTDSIGNVSPGGQKDHVCRRHRWYLARTQMADSFLAPNCRLDPNGRFDSLDRAGSCLPLVADHPDSSGQGFQPTGFRRHNA